MELTSYVAELLYFRGGVLMNPLHRLRCICIYSLAVVRSALKKTRYPCLSQAIYRWYLFFIIINLFTYDILLFIWKHWNDKWKLHIFGCERFKLLWIVELFYYFLNYRTNSCFDNVWSLNDWMVQNIHLKKRNTCIFLKGNIKICTVHACVCNFCFTN